MQDPLIVEGVVFLHEIAGHIEHGQLLWLGELPLVHVVVGDEQFRELLTGLCFLRHGVGALKGIDEEVGASVQFPDFGTVVVGDHDLALHGACEVPQAQVVSPTEFSVVHVLAVKVWRVSVDKG